MFLVEIETTRLDPENVIYKLRRELELVYGYNAVVTEWREPIRWASGDSK